MIFVAAVVRVPGSHPPPIRASQEVGEAAQPGPGVDMRNPRLEDSRSSLAASLKARSLRRRRPELHDASHRDADARLEPHRDADMQLALKTVDQAFRDRGAAPRGGLPGCLRESEWCNKMDNTMTHCCEGLTCDGAKCQAGDKKK